MYTLFSFTLYTAFYWLLFTTYHIFLVPWMYIISGVYNVNGYCNGMILILIFILFITCLEFEMCNWITKKKLVFTSLILVLINSFSVKSIICKNIIILMILGIWKSWSFTDLQTSEGTLSRLCQNRFFKWWLLNVEECPF